MTEPGLGSGALREALVDIQLVHETKYGHRSDTDWQWSCHCGAEAKVESWDACHRKSREHWADVILDALSLSSPIEPLPDYPGCTVNELALELKRTVMVLCETRKHTGARPCKFCTDMHLWRLYRGVTEPALRTCNCGNPAEPHLESVHVAEVRPTSQASSEIREARAWHWQNDGEDHLETLANNADILIRAADLRALLASRQGAGGK